MSLIFDEVDIYDYEAVTAYFQKHYPQITNILQTFRLTKGEEMVKILRCLGPGEQLTFHAFPGSQLSGNAYVFPRFLRVEGCKEKGKFRVTREKAVRERFPTIMISEDVVSYYYQLADISYLQAEQEVYWATLWPPEQKFSRR
jgi:hypothetical protein